MPTRRVPWLLHCVRVIAAAQLAGFPVAAVVMVSEAHRAAGNRGGHPDEDHQYTALGWGVGAALTLGAAALVLVGLRALRRRHERRALTVAQIVTVVVSVGIGDAGSPRGSRSALGTLFAVSALLALAVVVALYLPPSARHLARCRSAAVPAR